MLAGGGWWGYNAIDGENRSPAPVTAPSQDRGSASSEARLVLETLEVRGRSPKTGYSRDRFGRGWIDVDHNGCDTRNDILRRDLKEVVVKPNTAECVIAAGVLEDPYTGSRIEFLRGNRTSTRVQIDHVVALSDAWQKGAQSWDEPTRIRFANDPLNLVAVVDEANRQKGDGDAATWLPGNRSYRCRYVARQVAVKAKYGLAVTQAEREAISRVLLACPGERLPAS